MKGGVTRKIEDTISALEKNQLKKALSLTEGHEKLSRHHQFVEEAARTCLANKGNKEVCQAAMDEAKDKIKETISLPIEDTSLTGLEEYLSPKEQPAVQPVGATPVSEKTDDELFEECEDCHVAVAAAKFADVCHENPKEAGGCEVLGRSLENENTEPADWVKAMVQTAEKATGRAKEEMVGAITELTDYLERRNSPFLKALDKEEGDGKVP